MGPPVSILTPTAHLLRVRHRGPEKQALFRSISKRRGGEVREPRGRTPDTRFCSLSRKSCKEWQKTTVSLRHLPGLDLGVGLLASSCFPPRKISLKRQTFITFPRDTSCGSFK